MVPAPRLRVHEETFDPLHRSKSAASPRAGAKIAARADGEGGGQ